MVKLRLYDRPLTRSYTGAREEQMSSLYERRSQMTVFAEKFFSLSASRKRVSVEEGSAALPDAGMSMMLENGSKVLASSMLTSLILT